jgi:pilus assembly protein CpaE
VAVRAIIATGGTAPFDAQQLLARQSTVEVAGVVNGPEETERAVREHGPRIVLVASTGEGDDAVELVRRVREVHPDLPVVVLATEPARGFLRKAFDAGASDVLQLPQEAGSVEFAIAKALERSLSAQAAHAQDETKGRLVCVLGPKGGTGKTLTSCNLAVGLVATGARVLIIDLDLQFGDVALCLGLSPERTLYDLAVSPGSLDEEKLGAYTLQHPTGVHALIAPSHPDQASSVTVDLLREVYAVAIPRYDYLVVDTPPGFTAEVITTIDAATDLVMVGMLDSLSLKNTKLGLDTLRLMGHDDTQTTLLLNRAQSRVGISQSDVVAILGREPDVYVPSDREIPRAVNEGVAIVAARPQSEPAASFRQLVSIITGEPGGDTTPVPVQQSGGLFRRGRR